MKKCKLITVFDPLCGWCYGFGPVLIQLREKYRNRIDVDVLPGGMITGNSVGPLANMASLISKAFPVVEEHTGIRFGEGFLKKLKEGRSIFSSLEPSNVFQVLREKFPGDTIEIAHEIQQLIYFDGIDPVDYDAYLPLFARRGMDVREVSGRLRSSETSQASVLDFAQVQKWGIRSFPACLAETPDGTLYGISSGYLPFPELEKRVRPYLLPEA